MYVGKVRKMRQDGLDKTKHKVAVTVADMRKLYDSGILCVDEPVALQRKVYVKVSLHFCLRGREGLRELKKDSFVVTCDENGQEYVTMAHNELEKIKRAVYVSKLHNYCPAFFRGPTCFSRGVNNGITICLLARTL